MSFCSINNYIDYIIHDYLTRNNYLSTANAFLQEVLISKQENINSIEVESLEIIVNDYYYSKSKALESLQNQGLNLHQNNQLNQMINLLSSIFYCEQMKTAGSLNNSNKSENINEDEQQYLIKYMVDKINKTINNIDISKEDISSNQMCEKNTWISTFQQIFNESLETFSKNNQSENGSLSQKSLSQSYSSSQQEFLNVLADVSNHVSNDINDKTISRSIQTGSSPKKMSATQKRKLLKTVDLDMFFQSQQYKKSKS